MAFHNANTLRAIPTFRAAGRVFGPSTLDRALGDYRVARDQVPGHDARVLAACAALGRANRTRPENRRRAKADAFRALNAARTARRQAIAARDAAGTALLALGGALEPVRVASDLTAGFAGVWIEDDPDTVAFLPRGGQVARCAASPRRACRRTPPATPCAACCCVTPP